MAPDANQCQTPIALTNRTGFLASVTSDETGCGNADTPWAIQAHPGQRINITLIDFTPDSSRVLTSSDGVRRTCRVYATVREGKGHRSSTICGGNGRVRTVLVSKNDAVEIRIISSQHPAKPINFILMFQGKRIISKHTTYLLVQRVLLPP